MDPTVELDGHVGTQLRTSSVSPIATLFQSISFMAPGGAIVFSLGIAVPLAGNALPVSVLIAGLACLFAAVALGQLPSAVPSAGGLYSYATAGLGRGTGSTGCCTGSSRWSASSPSSCRSTPSTSTSAPCSRATRSAWPSPTR